MIVKKGKPIRGRAGTNSPKNPISGVVTNEALTKCFNRKRIETSGTRGKKEKTFFPGKRG